MAPFTPAPTVSTAAEFGRAWYLEDGGEPVTEDTVYTIPTVAAEDGTALAGSDGNRSTNRSE